MTIKTFLDTKSDDVTVGNIVFTAKDAIDTLNINTLLTFENIKLKKKLSKMEDEIEEIKKKIE